ncbi:hypothetical protein JMA_04540 [Jeotgalibacillus malaysiensis]|uniref:DUF6440 domain-containing protein n=1 Tax=Jeotgalibacillus malaysiensis TaxID=1508404 RepID=A0A0B5AI82_9BACL|nr:DUF6440 family protein [Jeotgalibacillus malaysiensis]AJD89771.1 hypothetical protein JMA_04540 [Jeotgalibacillus malaysiensis]
MLFKKTNKEIEVDRFEVKSVQDIPSLGRITILVDRETGVHYMQTWVGTGGGVTPLLDEHGKVIIEKPFR